MPCRRGRGRMRPTRRAMRESFRGGARFRVVTTVKHTAFSAPFPDRCGPILCRRCREQRDREGCIYMRERVQVPSAPRTRVAAVLLVAFAVFLLFSCEGAGRDPGAQDDIGEPTPEQQGQGSTASQSYATLETVTRRPGIFYGERVTVDGRVGRNISANTFSLTSDDAAQSDDSFEVEAALVAGDDGSIPDLSEGERVRVTGEVRELNLKKIEREFGVELADSLRREFEEKPAIYPASVETLAAGGETTGM